MCAGIVRVARPTDSGTALVLGIQTAASAGAATVTIVRTASQAIRRAVSGWIGPTPCNAAGCAALSGCSLSAFRVSDRSVSALTVTVRCGRCPCTSR